MSGGFKHRHALLTATVAIVCAVVPQGAFAQAQTFQFNIPARSLDSALRTFARAARQQVVFDSKLVRGLRSPVLLGSHTAEEAIRMLLAGSGLEAKRGSRGAWIVQIGSPETRAQAPGSTDRIVGTLQRQGIAEENEKGKEARATTPDILVTGSRNWTLNTGIKRTKDDSQPFTVFTRDDIKKSGAVDIETFLRNQLTSNASAGTGEQAGAGQTSTINRSSINLRGLSARDTLVLVDGRRQAGVSTGLGDIEQASITGIPLASIERIEVLASSASGLYGLGATGGVVNVVLRRDYVGGEITGTYADTGDFKAADRRLDGTYAFNLEHGRTNVSLNGSYRTTRPLLYNERDLLQRGRAFAFKNDPTFFEGNPPLGATPNIVSVTTDPTDSFYVPLTLKPEYGGASLGSTTTFVPSGYRGVALDGVAPLLANAGKLNLNLSNSAGGDGGRSPIIVGSRQWSGSVAIRREMNDWLKLYVEVAASKSITSSPFSRAPRDTISLEPDSPDNPFEQRIRVSFPNVGADQIDKSIDETRRLLGGAIVKLPYEWQGGIDLSYNHNRYSSTSQPPGVTLDSYLGLFNGTYNVLTDTASLPVKYEYIKSRYGNERSPATSSIIVATAKLAGPLPIRLPAGRPTLSINVERSKDILGQARIINNNFQFSEVEFSPRRYQTIDSAYLEMRVPIISETMSVPLVQALEFQMAARHERYQGRGATALATCLVQSGPFASDDDVTSLTCPPADEPVEYATTSNSHTDPSISLKWQVIRDLTLRASYARGYLPPRLTDLVKQTIDYQYYVDALDPQRGREIIGTPVDFGNYGTLTAGFDGGNANVKPETSKTLTVGAILTPRFLPGFRFSADWTRIRKKNNYFRPGGLLVTGDTRAGQAAFEQFLKLFPERFIRGPASDGYAVGPIISIDQSLINLAGSSVEAIDFTTDYSHALWGGTLQLGANATRLLELKTQIVSSIPADDYTGVSTNNFTAGGGDFGSIRWKGNFTVSWSNTHFSLGAAGRYFDGYYLYLDHSIEPSQNSARVSSQAYFDVFGTYTIASGLTLKAGVNDVFDKSPPLVPSEGYYSRYGDPRLRNFYVSLTKAL